MNPTHPLIMLGVDYTQASTRVRASMSLSLSQRQELSRALGRERVVGFVQIATCNRTLWLSVARHPEWAGQLLEAQAQSRWSGLLEPGQDRIRPRLFMGMQAVHELMRIATGLRSFVVGERQVSGQVHRAFESARRAELGHPLLNMLDTSVGRAVRRIQALQGFGAEAEGLHTVVEDRLQAELGAPSGRKIRVLGAGEIGQAIHGRLAHQGWCPLMANRTPRTDLGWEPIEPLRGAEDPAEALILATGSRTPIWSLRDLPPTVRDGQRPLLIIDAGSPAQSHPDVSTAAGVKRIDLDQLMMAARPPLSAEILDEVELAVLEESDQFRQKLVRRSWSGAWRAHQTATAAIAHEALPACLERHGIGHGSERRSLLEDELRQMITRYGHVLLDAMARGVPEGMDAGGDEHEGAEK